METIVRRNFHGTLQFKLSAIDAENTSVALGSKKIIIRAPLTMLDNAWTLWLQGEYIQHAFSALSPDEREFFMTGITPEEWRSIIPDDDGV